MKKLVLQFTGAFILAHSTLASKAYALFCPLHQEHGPTATSDTGGSPMGMGYLEIWFLLLVGCMIVMMGWEILKWVGKPFRNVKPSFQEPELDLDLAEAKPDTAQDNLQTCDFHAFELEALCHELGGEDLYFVHPDVNVRQPHCALCKETTRHNILAHSLSR